MAIPIGIALPAWSVRLITELDAADERAKELVIGLNLDQLNWQPRQVHGVSGNVLNICASPTKSICQRSQVRWRENRSLRFRRSYRGGSVGGLLTTTSSHPLRASTPVRQRRLCQASESSLPFWIAFYAVTKRHASSFVMLLITM